MSKHSVVEEDKKRQPPVRPMCEIFVLTSRIVGTYGCCMQRWLWAMSFLAPLGMSVAVSDMSPSLRTWNTLIQQMKSSLRIEGISIKIFVLPTIKREKKSIRRRKDGEGCCATDALSANPVKGNENGVANVHEAPSVSSCCRCHLNPE